jgi:cytochrome P450
VGGPPIRRANALVAETLRLTPAVQYPRTPNRAGVVLDPRRRHGCDGKVTTVYIRGINRDRRVA